MPVNLPDSRSSIKTDPLRNFKFQVQIHHTLLKNDGTKRGSLTRLGFMNVSGLNIETSVIAYREGGYNTTAQKMPGQSEFTPLTFSRGVMLATPTAYEWVREVFSVIQGGGTFALKPGRDFRSTIDIKVLAHPHTNQGEAGTPVKAWFKVFNAWPASIGFSDLDAGGNAVFMEQMVIQHEGWRVRFAENAYNTDASEPTASDHSY